MAPGLTGNPSNTRGGYMNPTNNNNGGGYIGNIGGAGSVKTPTALSGAYQPGNYNYSSLPPVPFNQTEFGQRFNQGLTSFGAISAPQRTNLENIGNNLSASINSLNAGYGAMSGYLQNENAIKQNMLGVDVQGNTRAQQNVQNRMGLNFGSYVNQYQTLAEQAMQQQRNATHDAVARGAYGGAGTRQDFTDIATNRDFALKNAGYEAQTRNATLGQQAIDLETTAAKFGLTGDQLNNQLQQGLTRLGLDQTTSVGSLLNALSSNNYQQVQLANNILLQALGFAGN